MGSSGGGGGDTTTVQEADPWEGLQPFLVGSGGQPIYETRSVENPNYRPNAQTGKGGNQPQFINQRVRVGTENQQPGIFPEAQALYEQGLNTYQGSTVVPFSQQTEDALSMQEQIARQGNPALQAANDRLGTIANQSAPQYGGHQDFMRAYGNDIANDVGNRFRLSGRKGSTKFGQALGNGLGDASQRVYQQEQDRNQASFFQNQEDQIRSAALAPDLDQARYQGAERLASVGGARDQLESEYQADNFRRFNESQDLPWEALNRYASILNSQQLPFSSSTTAPNNSNRIGGALGGAASGAAIGSQILPGVGTGIGALGGAVLGGLF